MFARIVCIALVFVPCEFADPSETDILDSIASAQNVLPVELPNPADVLPAGELPDLPVTVPNIPDLPVPSLPTSGLPLNITSLDQLMQLLNMVQTISAALQGGNNGNNGGNNNPDSRGDDNDQNGDGNDNTETPTPGDDDTPTTPTPPPITLPTLPPGLPPTLPPGFPPTLPPGVPPNLPPGVPPGLPPGVPPGLPPGVPPGVPPGLPPNLPPGFPPGVPPGFPPGVPPGVPPTLPPGVPPTLPPGVPPTSPPTPGPNMTSPSPNNDDVGVERPCHVSFVSCIKKYFARNAKCKLTRGYVPDHLRRAISTTFLPRVNLTLTGFDVVYSGLNGRIDEFFINKQTDKLVITVEYTNVTYYSKDTYYRFHRPAREPIVNKDYLYANFGSLSTTTVIPNIRDLQLEKSETFAYINDSDPSFGWGPKAFVSRDPSVPATLPELLADEASTVREFFLTEGAFIAATFIQKVICDFGLKIL